MQAAEMKKHINEWGRGSLGRQDVSSPKSLFITRKVQRGKDNEDAEQRWKGHPQGEVLPWTVSGSRPQRPRSLRSTDPRRDGLELAAKRMSERVGYHSPLLPPDSRARSNATLPSGLFPFNNFHGM